MNNKIVFNTLPMTEKALLIAEFGLYLESIESYDYWLHLYSLGNGFIEIQYNNATRQIDNINSINYKELDKFVNRIILRGINISSK